MSKNGERTPDDIQVDPQGSMIFDFLYCDSRRVGSLLAQCKANPLLISKNDGGFLDRNRGDKVACSDPDLFWKDAVSLIDVLDSNGFVKNMSDAYPGDIVLLAGSINVISLEFIKKALHDDLLRMMFQNSLNDSQRRILWSVARQLPAEIRKNDQILLAIFGLFSHSTQVHVRGDVEAWLSIDAKYLSESVEDLLLQFGSTIGGNWNVIGILNAQPDEPNHLLHAQTADKDTVPRKGLLESLSKSIEPICRAVVGRPAEAYGITPLLIFRQVAG